MHKYSHAHTYSYTSECMRCTITCGSGCGWTQHANNTTDTFSLCDTLPCMTSLLALGHGLTLRHYRSGAEVTPSVDQDLNYDFNFQQYRSVTPRKVMPVSVLLLRSSTSDTQSTNSQSLSVPCYSFLSITLHREMSLNWNATTGALIGTAHSL